MSKFWIIAVTLLFACVGFADGSPCARQIVFLPQFHETTLGDGQITQELVYLISKAQFAVARFLNSHRSTPIFAEGTYNVITLDWYRTNADETGQARVRIYPSVFPTGIPTSYKGLSKSQAELLAEDGGDLAQLFLGVVRAIYPVAPDAQVERNYFHEAQEWEHAHPNQDLFSDPHMRWIGSTRRERLALGQINQYFSANPGQREAILLFGAFHRFDRYPDLFDPQCVVVPHEFRGLMSATFEKDIDAAYAAIDRPGGHANFIKMVDHIFASGENP